MESEIMLDIRGVSKSFAKTKAVAGVDLKVHSGEIYALIGPNGSGKTTLIKTVVGLLSPDKGEVVVLENRVTGDSIETKQKVGYVPDKPEGYQYLTGLEFIRMTARLRGLSERVANSRSKELIESFDIADVLKERIEGYSRGSLQKMAFIAALISEPALLVIDEPVAGLDPLSVRVFGETLLKFTKAGGGVLLVTHTLDFAQEYATTVGVMKSGKLIREGSAKKGVQKMYGQKI